MANPMLEAAVRYAKLGWPVFPVQPLSKQPYAKTNGCLDATSCLADINTWWEEFPDANLAIATGQPGPDVLDIDVKAGAPGFATLRALNLAGLVGGSFAIAATPSGGRHLYYHGTDQPNGSLRLHGVDFRGRGGYVLAPPSILDQGVYTWDRRWAFTGKTLDWTAIREFYAPPPREVRERGPGNFEGLFRYMAEMPPGGRNNSLYSIARQILDEGGTETDLDDLAEAAFASGLTRREIETTIRSAERR